jgi:hypothetical protein
MQQMIGTNFGSQSSLPMFAACIGFIGSRRYCCMNQQLTVWVSNAGRVLLSTVLVALLLLMLPLVVALLLLLPVVLLIARCLLPLLLLVALLELLPPRPAATAAATAAFATVF